MDLTNSNYGYLSDSINLSLQIKNNDCTFAYREYEISYSGRIGLQELDVGKCLVN